MVTQRGVGGCLSIDDAITNGKEKTDALAYRVLFLSSFDGKEAESVVASDHASTSLVEQKGISRKNLSFQYYRIMHVAELSGKTEREMYSTYLEWLRSVYGQNLPVEGEILRKFLEDGGQKNNLSEYLASIVSESLEGKNVSSDNHVNLFETCKVQELARMTETDKIIALYSRVKELPTKTIALAIAAMVSAIAVVAALIHKRTLRRKRVEEAEKTKETLRIVSSFRGSAENDDVQKAARSLIEK